MTIQLFPKGSSLAWKDMTREWVLAWASHYSYQEDTRILGEIGLNARRRGWYERQEFLDVVRWKTKGRGISRAKRNETGLVMAATQASFLAAHSAVAVSALTSLAGVQVPVASALLTASYPDRYTVTDFRSQESIVDWGGIASTAPPGISRGMWLRVANKPCDLT